MSEAFPLHWPEGWPRTPSGRRNASRFRTPLGQARSQLLAELHRLGGRHVVVSTNIPVRRDGIFYASHREPDDPGVAVYFQWQGRPHVLACDSYQSIRENVKAVAATIEALRTIERHGASQLLERAVSGFAALPPGDGAPEPPERPWWVVLGLDGTLAGFPIPEIAGDPNHRARKPALALFEGIYRDEVHRAHPDRPGGSAERTRELNRAIAQAREALG